MAGDQIIAFLLIVTGAAGPPVATGSFWIMIAIWGVVSVLFDDETVRGIPGLDEIDWFRAAAEEKRRQRRETADREAE